MAKQSSLTVPKKLTSDEPFNSSRLVNEVRRCDNLQKFQHLVKLDKLWDTSRIRCNTMDAAHPRSTCPPKFSRAVELVDFSQIKQHPLTRDQRQVVDLKSWE